MPNTFGNKPILDPKFVADRCAERGLPTDWLALATSATIPTMDEPGRAFFLMARKDVQSLSVTAEHILDLTDWNKTYTLKRWTIDRADIVVAGMADDNSVMLVQAYDRRGRMLKSAFSAAYNLRVDGSYVSSTLNGSSPWSWSGMLSNLWSKIPDAGSAPSLPFTPSGTPEGFDFYGHSSAFMAYCEILRRIACVLVYDPIADAFTVEQAGATDAGFTTFTNASKAEKLFDSHTVEGNRIPANLKVYFRRSPRPKNGDDPYYEVSSAVSGGNAGTVAVFDELFALGVSGTPSNAAALTTRATERASDLARRLGTDRLSRTLRGVWPTAPAALGGKATALEIRDHGGGLAASLRYQDYGTARPGLMFDVDNESTSTLDQCRQTISVCWNRTAIDALTGGSSTSDIVTALQAQTLTVAYRGWCGPITDASWASDVGTITAVGHPLVAGDTVIITDVDPVGYNGTFTVASVSGDDFTVAIASDPGTYVEGGIVSAPYAVYCVDDPDDCCPTTTAIALACCAGFAAANAIITPTGSTGYGANYTLPTRTWEYLAFGYGGWQGQTYYIGPPSSGSAESGLHNDSTGGSQNLQPDVFFDCEGGNPRIRVIMTGPTVVSVTPGAGWSQITGGDYGDGFGFQKALSCATWSPASETIGTFSIDWGGGDSGTITLAIST